MIAPKVCADKHALRRPVDSYSEEYNDAMLLTPRCWSCGWREGRGRAHDAYKTARTDIW